MRRTFQDLQRPVDTDDIVTRSISGHATEVMQEHDSTVNLDEAEKAIDSVVSLVKGGTGQEPVCTP
jgi:hypothetical protein